MYNSGLGGMNALTIAQIMEKMISFSEGNIHDIDGIDYQILIEADYIANASENGYSKMNVANFMNKIMTTESGKRLTKAVFCL